MPDQVRHAGNRPLNPSATQNLPLGRRGSVRTRSRTHSEFVIPDLIRDLPVSFALDREEGGCRIKSGMTATVRSHLDAVPKNPPPWGRISTPSLSSPRLPSPPRSPRESTY